MKLYHLDYWMLSLVRWEPVVDRNYPTTITFWVRVLGVPLHFWASPTFECTGQAIKEVIEIDLDESKIQVTVDGFHNLCFETLVVFRGGEEIMVSLRYERLFGYQNLLRSLSRLILPSSRTDRLEEKRDDKYTFAGRRDDRSASYKGLVIHGEQEIKEVDLHGSRLGITKY